MAFCSGHGSIINHTCVCYDGWSGRDLWANYDDCQVSEKAMSVFLNIGLVLMSALLVMCLRAFCILSMTPGYVQRSTKMLYLQQTLFAMPSIGYLALALQGVRHGDSDPLFMLLFLSSTGALVSSLIVVSRAVNRGTRLAIDSSYYVLGLPMANRACCSPCCPPCHPACNRLSFKLGARQTCGMLVCVWAFYLLAIVATLARPNEYGMILNISVMFAWLVLLLGIFVVSTSLAVLRTILAGLEGSAGDRIRRTDRLLDRAIFRTRFSGWLIILVGMPALVFLPCIVFPIYEAIYDQSYIYFNAVLGLILVASMYINVVFLPMRPPLRARPGLPAPGLRAVRVSNSFVGASMPTHSSNGFKKPLLYENSVVSTPLSLEQGPGQPLRDDHDQVVVRFASNQCTIICVSTKIDEDRRRGQREDEWCSMDDGCNAA